MRPVPQILVPWIPAEAITVAEAANIARRGPKTVREWAARYDIGRPVVTAQWMISRVALTMLLEGNKAALDLYLAGDRSSDTVRAYFQRVGVDL